jgi:outer membrane protein OmpA-like peptidoglycan-associated protein
MARSNRRGREGDTNYWIGYTDLLSNSLLVLLLTIAVAALARANNEKPPFLPLTEKESFRFGTGSYQLTPQFKAALNSKLPWIQEQIKKYRIDIVEVVGHTDGQPSPGSSNLDLLLPKAASSPNLKGYQSGSNTDLGLLRALAVSNYLKAQLAAQGIENVTVRPYSAGSLIATDGKYSPADTKDRADRRRIELRFTREEKSAS